MSQLSDLFNNPQLTYSPNLEPPGWNVLRDQMMRKIFELQSNPYGYNPGSGQSMQSLLPTQGRGMFNPYSGGYGGGQSGGGYGGGNGPGGGGTRTLPPRAIMQFLQQQQPPPQGPPQMGPRAPVRSGGGGGPVRNSVNNRPKFDGGAVGVAGGYYTMGQGGGFHPWGEGEYGGAPGPSYGSGNPGGGGGGGGDRPMRDLDPRSVGDRPVTSPGTGGGSGDWWKSFPQWRDLPYAPGDPRNTPTPPNSGGSQPPPGGGGAQAGGPHNTRPWQGFDAAPAPPMAAGAAPPPQASVPRGQPIPTSGGGGNMGTPGTVPPRSSVPGAGGTVPMGQEQQKSGGGGGQSASTGQGDRLGGRGGQIKGFDFGAEPPPYSDAGLWSEFHRGTNFNPPADRPPDANPNVGAPPIYQGPPSPGNLPSPIGLPGGKNVGDVDQYNPHFDGRRRLGYDSPYMFQRGPQMGYDGGDRAVGVGGGYYTMGPGGGFVPWGEGQYGGAPMGGGNNQFGGGDNNGGVMDQGQALSALMSGAGGGGGGGGFMRRRRQPVMQFLGQDANLGQNRMHDWGMRGGTYPSAR